MKGRKMKIRLLVGAAFLMISTCLFTTNVYSQTLLGDYLKEKDISIEISATVDYYDKYVWRGFLLDNDSVLQPGVAISSCGFEGGFWGSWDVESHDGLASDEVDGYIGYSFDLGFLSEELSFVGISVGNTWYSFPEADLYSKEAYLGLSFDTFLSPYVTWYADYEKEDQGGANGNYIIMGIGHSFSLMEEAGVTLDLGLEYGINNDAFIVGKGSYLLSTLGFTVPLTEKITMTPMIGYSVPFDDLKDGGGNDQAEQFYGGVSLAFNF